MVIQACPLTQISAEEEELLCESFTLTGLRSPTPSIVAGNKCTVPLAAYSRGGPLKRIKRVSLCCFDGFPHIALCLTILVFSWFPHRYDKKEMVLEEETSYSILNNKITKSIIYAPNVQLGISNALLKSVRVYLFTLFEVGPTNMKGGGCIQRISSRVRVYLFICFMHLLFKDSVHRKCRMDIWAFWVRIFHKLQ